jgi:tripartite-type tricarboxylate transporter receptor subunit TctC
VSGEAPRAASFSLPRLRGRVGEGANSTALTRGKSPLPGPPPQAGEGNPVAPACPHTGDRSAASLGIATFLVTFALALPVPAHAQSVESFYRGRTVTIVVGYSVGGGYDAHGRVLARHLGKHIPGNPSVVVQNMPGAGSLRAANYLYNAAPKDGATLGVFARGMAMEPLIGAGGTNFDARKFAWIGSGTNEVSVCATWHASKVKTWSDALATPFTVAGEGSGSDPDIFSVMLRNVLGAKMRLVSGYPGGADMTLAIERGEVDGRCGWTWSSVKLQRPDWVADHKLNVLIQLATQPSPELPGVPFIFDLATTERQRRIVDLVLSRQEMGRPLVAPPGTPPDRKEALRDAFDATMADPDFIAEATGRSLEVNPVKGADLDKLLERLYSTPSAILAETKAIIAEGAK